MNILNKFNKDNLLFHKIGVVLGAIFGVLFGMMITDAADKMEPIEDAEAEQDDESKDATD